MTVQTYPSRGAGTGYLERPAASGLAEVIEIILDKGIVIDIYIRVALVGIELLTIDARIVIASVDTYLRFAEATNRLDLKANGAGKPLDEFLGNMQEHGASSIAKGAVDGVKRALVGSSSDRNRDDGERRRPAARRSSSQRQTAES